MDLCFNFGTDQEPVLVPYEDPEVLEPIEDCMIDEYLDVVGELSRHEQQQQQHRPNKRRRVAVLQTEAELAEKLVEIEEAIRVKMEEIAHLDHVRRNCYIMLGAVAANMYHDAEAEKRRKEKEVAQMIKVLFPTV